MSFKRVATRPAKTQGSCYSVETVIFCPIHGSSEGCKILYRNVYGKNPEKTLSQKGIRLKLNKSHGMLCYVHV